VRRAALKEIGGFPQMSLAEDTLCSLMLNRHGWCIAYVHEELQWGIMPDTVGGHIKQRTKWVSKIVEFQPVNHRH